MREVCIKLLVVLGTGLLFFLLAVLAYGGFDRFFSHPALIVLAASGLIMTVAAVFSRGNLSTGEREDRSNRWVLAAFTGIGILSVFLPPLSDRFNFWVLGGETIRWIGTVLFILGGILRMWPVFVLGRRFSGLVAIQPDHKLVTDGIYRIIRHPSYLGLLVNLLGWGLAFRSIVGVLLVGLAVPPLVARIRSEERLLQSQFGAVYDAYRAQTRWRLIPGIY